MVIVLHTWGANGVTMTSANSLAAEMHGEHRRVVLVSTVGLLLSSCLQERTWSNLLEVLTRRFLLRAYPGMSHPCSDHCHTSIVCIVLLEGLIGVYGVEWGMTWNCLMNCRCVMETTMSVNAQIISRMITPRSRLAVKASWNLVIENVGRAGAGRILQIGIY